MQRLPRYVPNRATPTGRLSGSPADAPANSPTASGQTRRAKAIAMPRPLTTPQALNRPAVWLMLLVVCALILSGCGSSEVPLSAAVTEPTQNSTFNVGDSITIKGKAAGSALKAIDLYVNSTLLARSNQPVATNEFEMQVNWTPDIDGPVILVIKGVNENDEAIISSDPVFITIAGSAAVTSTETLTNTEGVPTADAGAGALPTAAPQPTLDPNQALPTTDPAASGIVTSTGTTTETTDEAGAAPTAGVTAEAVATTGSGTAGGATTVSPIGDVSNVRKGPGLGYEIVGTLAAGQSATVRGRNADTTWYQIAFATGDNGVGWVSGEVVTVTGSTTGLTVADAPPLPTSAPVTPAPEVPAATVPVIPIDPAAATATTVPAAAALPYDQGSGLEFRPRNGIDYDALAVNEQTTAVWSIKGATAAQIEVVGSPAPDIYDCPAGTTANVSVQGRQNLNLPDGEFPFSIGAPGYYLVTIYVSKADGGSTTIPRGIAVGCYKKPGR